MSVLDWQLFIIFSAVAWWGYWLYRITNPLTCACGYKSIFVWAFKRHLLMGHKWVEPHS